MESSKHAYIDVAAHEKIRRVSPDDIELTVDAWISPRQITCVIFWCLVCVTYNSQAKREARVNNGASSPNLSRVYVARDSG